MPKLGINQLEAGDRLQRPDGREIRVTKVYRSQMFRFDDQWVTDQLFVATLDDVEALYSVSQNQHQLRPLDQGPLGVL